MAAVVYRGRSLRSRRFGGRNECGEELVTLDYAKAPEDNVKEVLESIVRRKGVSKSKKLGYFNAFVRLCYRFGSKFSCRYSDEEMVACLRLGLVHDAKEMRAACLRALRYWCNDASAVKALLRLRLDYLICRSLDICLDNEIERIHAMRLIRKILHICPDQCPLSFLHVMISIANDGTRERDRMVRICLATLCELAIQNTQLVCKYGGLAAILRSVLNYHQLSRINESLLATVVSLVNHPRTRHYIKAGVDLEQMLAPFTDSHYKFSGDTGSASSGGDEKENRFVACKLAIASMFKTWPGIVRLCKPDSSGLQSLLGVLYLPMMETRKEILSLLYEIFRLHMPEWTDNFSQALISVDPSEMLESWRLIEGFVAEEGKAVLAHPAKTRPNLVENHIALVLAAFISAGLLEALVEVITSSDIYVAVRATILLGDLLHMANTILPYQCGHYSHCLPTLMALASSFDASPQQRHQASQAVNCLSRLHTMKKRGVVPCSLFLDQIVQNGSLTKAEPYQPLLWNKEKLIEVYDNVEGDHEVMNIGIKDSRVLQTKENLAWDWDLVAAILKWPDEAFKKLEEQHQQRFVKRLVFFFRPTTKLFSTVELSHEDHKKLALAGQFFIDFLLDCYDITEEVGKYIDELLIDINKHLLEVVSCPTTPDALFSPTNLLNTCSQYYFLIVGRLSTSTKGEKFMNDSGIYQCLEELISSSCQDTYIKLIVSSLDYTRDGLSRVLLAKGLSSTSESGRLYCVNFMRVLLRAQMPFFGRWGLEMLVRQLYDQSKPIAMEALSVLSEACEDEANIHTLVGLKPSVLHLGHKGSMLLARFLCIPSGYKFLVDCNFIHQELDKWHSDLNENYVHIVDERLNEAFTTYEKAYDGSYNRRSHRRQARKDVYVPVHLYGQLVQHKHSFQLLLQQEYLIDYFDVVRSLNLHTDAQVLKVKAALWAVGHIGTSVWGLSLLEDQVIIPEIIKLAEESGVFSIRGTAYFVLGLIASTSRGADILNTFGWECVRHKRSEVWPVIHELTEPVDLDGLSNSPTCSSFASLSTKSEGGRSSSVILSSSNIGLDEEGRASPHSYGSSPKPAFVMEDRSRSSTGPTSGILGSSCETSPHHSVEYIADGTRVGTESPLVIIEVSDMSEDASDSIGAVKTDAPDATVDDSKARSQSMPAKRSPTPEVVVIHPRSSSDSQALKSPSPVRPEDPSKMEGSYAASVHFSDTIDGSVPEKLSLSRKSSTNSILRRKSSRSGSEDRSGSSDHLLSKPGRGYSNESTSTKGSRSYSSESSSQVTQVTTVSGKSHSDSIQTDASSSGFSSFDSVSRPQVSDQTPLTPIASASSLATENNSKRQSMDDEENMDKDKPLIHHSDINRKLANLKRMPKLRRRYSNPVLGHISSTAPVEVKNPFQKMVFTSTRDLRGYATLRELKKQRTKSTELEIDAPVVTEFESSPSYAQKSRSLDLRMARVRNGFIKKVIPRLRRQESLMCGCGRGVRNNLSSNSLDELDAPYPRPLDTDLLHTKALSGSINLRKLQSRPGRAEYIGLCLPVDVNMLFQVHEGEDSRSHSPLPEPDDLEKHTKTRGRSPQSRSASQSAEPPDDGLDQHNVDTCLSCLRLRRADYPVHTISTEFTDTDTDDAFSSAKEGQSAGASLSASAQPSPMAPGMHGRLAGLKSRNSSLSDMALTIPGSITSTTSMESAATLTRPVMSEDSSAGRTLIRKEVLRFIVNLAGSVGALVKNSEQGLLILKQKFPKAFQDPCLYSEICHLLAEYNFRLNCRRFIQELFVDVNYDKMYEEPREILEITDDSSGSDDGLTESDVRLERVLESIA